jgi:thiol-disulfide isomerase/thioredoxin
MTEHLSNNGNTKSLNQKFRQNVARILKSSLRDLAMLLAIIVGIGMVQMLYFQGKDVPKGLLEEVYPTLDGTSRTLMDKDHFSLVYVFAPWCGVCKMSASNINSLAGYANIQALALSYEKESDVRSFTNETDLRVPVVLGQGKLEDGLNVGQFPTYFILDNRGKIVLGWSGYTTTLGLWMRVWGVMMVGSFVANF